MGDTGHLEGLFHCTARGNFWLRDDAGNFSGYVFAIPDERDLLALADSPNPATIH